jgi:hypothetical protein
MKSDPRDYQLDISSLPKQTPRPETRADAKAVDPRSLAGSKAQYPVPPSQASGARPYLSILFSCCNVYQRVYRDPDGKHYTGRCPKCLSTIKFVIDPGGAAGRSFVVE